MYPVSIYEYNVLYVILLIGITRLTCTTHVLRNKMKQKQTLNRMEKAESHDTHIYLLDRLSRCFYVTFDHSQDATCPHVQSVLESIVPKSLQDVGRLLFTVLPCTISFRFFSKGKG